ncbi:MAG: hypothetical protein H6728_13665 [Myxococcales bacterium]|nr:hypothetical protein [Myxococcales bacterium]
MFQGKSRRHLLAAFVVFCCILLLWWGRQPPSAPSPPNKQRLRIIRASTPSSSSSHTPHEDHPPHRHAPKAPNARWQAQLRKGIRALNKELLKGSQVWGKFPNGNYLMALRQPTPQGQAEHPERPQGFRLWQVTPRGAMTPLSLELEVGSAQIDPKNGRVAAITPDQELHLSGPQGQGPFAPIAKEAGYFPSWDAKGQRLAFSQKIDMISQKLQIYDLQTRQFKTLLAQEQGLAQPIWSPQGDEVIYISTRTGLASLWKVSISQAQPQQLTNRGLTLGQGLPPSYVPPPHLGRQSWEGRWLVYDSSDSFWAVQTDGKGQKKLADTSPIRFQWLQPGRVVEWTLSQSRKNQATLPIFP